MHDAVTTVDSAQEGGTASAYGGAGARMLRAIANELRAAVLVGTRRESYDPADASGMSYNSAAFALPGRGVIGAYDKHYLVPFLEATPAWAAPFIKGSNTLGSTVGLKNHLLPGDDRALRAFSLGPDAAGHTHRIAPTVCYDVCFPDVHRRYMQSPADERPDVFVCVMNESFDNTKMIPPLTLRHAQLRAIECRRPYYRVSNGGCSAIVDSCGRVLSQMTDTNDTPAILEGQVPGDQRLTLYCILGEWIPLACVALVALSGVGLSRAARWLPQPRCPSGSSHDASSRQPICLTDDTELRPMKRHE